MFWVYLALSLLLAPLAAAIIDVAGAVRAKYSSVGPVADAGHAAEEFAVLVPIWGAVRYLENTAFLASYGSRVTLCTTAEESAGFYTELRAIADRYHLNVFVASPTTAANSSSNRRDIGGTTRDRLVREALRTVSAPYVVCIDADTITEQPLSALVREMRTRELDLASVILKPSNSDTWLARLQIHEYRVAMSLRRVAPWLVSGACHGGRTAAMRAIMERHSLFFQGNDVETGVLGHALGLRVGHIPFAVPTTVPSRIRPWLRQRWAWAGGEFRLFVVNFRLIRLHPVFWAYGLIIMFGLLPLRWLNAIDHPRALAGVGALYLAMVVFVNWRHRDRWLMFLPLYTAFNSLILIPLALPSYLWMALRSRNTGLIRPRRSYAPRRLADSPAIEQVRHRAAASESLTSA